MRNTKRLAAFGLILLLLFSNINIGVFAAFDSDASSAQLSGLEAQLASLYSKTEQCRKLGIPTDYEDAYCEIIKKSVSYVREDIAAHTSGSYSEKVTTDLEELIPYQLTELQKLITAVDESLDGYLNCTKTPLTAGSYQSGAVSVNGREMYGTVKNANGRKSAAPMYFVGYGHFTDVVGSFPYYEATGISSAQLGIHPYDYLKEPGKPTMWTEAHTAATVSYGAEVTDGNTVIKMTNSGGSGTAARLEQALILEPNSTYQLSFKAKSDADDAMIVRYGRVESGWNLIKVKKSDDYREYTGTLVTSAYDARARVSICADNTTDGTYIDDICLVKLATGENVIRNSGFERKAEDYNEELAIDRDMLAYLAEILDRAESHNIALDIISNIEGLPYHIVQKYPDIAGSYTSHLNLDLTSDKLKEVLGLYYREIAKTIAGHSALKGFCLANEPEYCTWNNPGVFEKEFIAYLKELYGNDITAMEKAHGRKYTDFEAVSMPTERSATPLFYDWKQFNDKVMVDFFGWIYNEVKTVAPNINCHIKLMANTGYREKEKFVYSGDTAFEALAEYSDYMGCDAYASWEHEAQPLMGKMMMYDLWGSVKAVPVVNTEDHVLIDQSVTVNDKIAPWIGADMWLGALHGRSETDIWMWGKSYMETHHYYGSISSRPDVQAEISTAALDLMRLSETVSAFVNRDADVAILYSDASRVYEKAYLNALYNAYMAASEQGLKVRFVTEKQIAENIVDLESCELVLAPLCNYLPESVYQKVYEYAANGGMLIGLGESCFQYDEYMKARDMSEIRDCVNTEFADMPVSGYNVADADAAKAFVKSSIDKLNIRRIKVYDAATDAEIIDAVYQMSETDENIYLSVCNLSYDNKEIYVTIDGVKQEELFEERSGDFYENTMPLEGYTPVMLNFEKNRVMFSSVEFEGGVYDKYGSGVIRSELIERLKSGNIMASAEVENPSAEEEYDAMFITALYCGDVMTDVVVNRAVIPSGETQNLQCVVEVPDTDLTDCCMKVFLWDGGTLLRPLMREVSLYYFDRFERVFYQRDGNILRIFGKCSSAEPVNLAVTVKNEAGEYAALDEIITKSDGSFLFDLTLNDKADGVLQVLMRADNTLVHEIEI